MSEIGLAFLMLAPLLGPPASQAPVGDFELRDYRGAARKLSDWHEKKLVVVIFLGSECRLARLYGPRLAELSHKYEQDTAFIGINSNTQDAVTAIARYAQTNHIDFPILKDVGNTVADRFGAERTPEVFVLDAQRRIRYRGLIDDQYGIGTERPQATHRYLEDALTDLLADRPVRPPRTEAVGCYIGKLGKPVADGAVTYCRDVAPILQRRCQSCHRPGQVAPFSLTSYKAAHAWADTIEEVVQQQRMPPWSADPRYGKFSNDTRLSDPEKQIMCDWIKAGCPEGNTADLPPPAKFSESWTIPTPDVVFSLPEPFTVPATGTVEYQLIDVDPGLREDTWVRAAEIRPTNRAVVHHCSVFLSPPGGNGPATQGRLGSFFLAGMAVGTEALILPDGMAKKIPAGWHLCFVMHYVTVGTVQTDQTRIGLVLADPKTVKKEVATKILCNEEIKIPPHAADHVIEESWRTDDDVLLLALFPHMHLRGKSFRYDVIYPDGSDEILLDIPHWDFNWQHRYVLAEAKRLPAGSRIRCVAHYDNSASNPANPDPNAEVHTGPQTTDEMFNGYFEIALADEDLTRPLSPEMRIWLAVKNVWSMKLAIGIGCGLAGFLFWQRFISRGRASTPTSSTEK